MNALINVINNQKKIIFANEGRLLKKSFFGLLILALAFQSGEFGNLVRNSMIDAYLQVSVFVGLTLFVFIGLDSLTKFDVKLFLSKTQKIHVPIAAFLGSIPGCGGAIIVVTQYIQGRISFGSLVAVLTATMGDAAFLILAMEPSTGLLIFSLGIIVGSLSGYIIDILHGTQFMMPESKINIEYEKIHNSSSSNTSDSSSERGSTNFQVQESKFQRIESIKPLPDDRESGDEQEEGDPRETRSGA